MTSESYKQQLEKKAEIFKERIEVNRVYHAEDVALFLDSFVENVLPLAELLDERIKAHKAMIRNNRRLYKKYLDCVDENREQKAKLDRVKQLAISLEKWLTPVGTDFTKIGQFHTTICKGCSSDVRAKCSIYVFPCQAARRLEEVKEALERAVHE